MDYQIRIPNSIPMRKQLEEVLYGLLTFIDAGNIYVSYKTGQPAIVTTILKKDCKQHGIMLERFSKKLVKDNPDTIFRFFDEKIARQGFNKGSPFLLMHCSLSELVYYQSKSKLFLPQYANVERLLKKFNKRSADDLDTATRQFEVYKAHITNNENENATVSLYSAIWNVYTCFAAFFIGYLEEYYEYPKFDYMYDLTNRYAPELKDIIDLKTKGGEELITPLQAAYNSSIRKHPIEPVEKSVLEQAVAKYQHLYAELENYYYRFFAGTKSKFIELNQSLYGGALILKEKLPTNYFVDHALTEISEIVRGFVKVRAIYCFGYWVIGSNKKLKVFSNELPSYHFYLLVLNREHRQNIVPEYNLNSAVEKKQNRNEPIFKPVNYKAGDIKSQMAAVIRYLPKYYQYTTLGTYNALLSLFNITAEEVKGQYNGKPRQGLVYFTLNEKREMASNPFKASLFGKGAGYTELQSHFEKSKSQLQNSADRSTLKATIEKAILATKNETEFKTALKEAGINTVVRRTADNRIYGITFIDHQSRSVWNGSQLAKNLSASTFNEWWINGNKSEIHLQNPNDVKSTNNSLIIGLNTISEDEKINPNLSDAANALSEIFDGLLPQAQAEDYEEEAFARQMKKKSKGLRR